MIPSALSFSGCRSNPVTWSISHRLGWTGFQRLDSKGFSDATAYAASRLAGLLRDYVFGESVCCRGEAEERSIDHFR